MKQTQQGQPSLTQTFGAIMITFLLLWTASLLCIGVAAVVYSDWPGGAVTCLIVSSILLLLASAK